MIFTQEHEELRRTVRNFVDKEINPHVDEWEKAGQFPIHEIFKMAGDLGLLAACRTFPLAGRIAHRSWNLTV